MRGGNERSDAAAAVAAVVVVVVVTAITGLISCGCSACSGCGIVVVVVVFFSFFSKTWYSTCVALPHNFSINAFTAGLDRVPALLLLLTPLAEIRAVV